jgi:hypothetical protein
VGAAESIQIVVETIHSTFLFRGKGNCKRFSSRSVVRESFRQRREGRQRSLQRAQLSNSRSCTINCIWESARQGKARGKVEGQGNAAESLTCGIKHLRGIPARRTRGEHCASTKLHACMFKGDMHHNNARTILTLLSDQTHEARKTRAALGTKIKNTDQGEGHQRPSRLPGGHQADA